MQDKLFPQIYRDLYGDAMLVPVRMHTNMAAETNRNIFHRVLLQKRTFISGGTQKQQNNTLSNPRTVLIAKFSEISPGINHFFNNSVVI